MIPNKSFQNVILNSGKCSHTFAAKGKAKANGKRKSDDGWDHNDSDSEDAWPGLVDVHWPNAKCQEGYYTRTCTTTAWEEGLFES